MSAPGASAPAGSAVVAAPVPTAAMAAPVVATCCEVPALTDDRSADDFAPPIGVPIDNV